jgi:hypothetical protein
MPSASMGKVTVLLVLLMASIIQILLLTSALMVMAFMIYFGFADKPTFGGFINETYPSAYVAPWFVLIFGIVYGLINWIRVGQSLRERNTNVGELSAMQEHERRRLFDDR